MATLPATANRLVLSEAERNQVLNAYRALMRDCIPFAEKEDRRIIRQAFTVAMEAHGGVRRKSGEPYILHPIAVARIVVREIGLQDLTSVISALLHDVVEDTYVSLRDVEERFGPAVARIVDGLTKVAQVFEPGGSKQAETFRKMLLTMSADVRVALIKIADRLHNLRTLDHMRRESQLKIAAETQYLYAPLAHRLGLYTVKTELEDIALSVTDPHAYEDIQSRLREGRSQRARYIQSFIQPIQAQMAAMGLHTTIKGRVKGIHSIYQKMKRQHVSFEEVYDVFAVRIVIHDIAPADEKWACWRVYSAITSTYRPHPERTRDWISIPKATGYESLHVTVMGPRGRWVEVQIRTERMDEHAEKGPAAHWVYKDNPKAYDEQLNHWLGRIRELLESNQLTSVDLVEEFQRNLTAEEIFVFTPKGDLITLPAGATALDLAYEIHTSIGHTCIGAKINSKVVPLSARLQSGDQIEIITSKKQEPKAEWLDFIHTQKARNAIKERLKRIRKEILARGHEIVQWKVQSLGYSLEDPKMRAFMAHFRIPNLDELYYRVGTHSIDARQIQAFIERHVEVEAQTLSLETESQKFDTYLQERLHVNPDGLVIGEDVEHVELATCCNPLPGDAVIGIMDPADGILVHRVTCKKATSLLSSYGSRLVKAKWGTDEKIEFLSAVRIIGQDRFGMLRDIVKTISVQQRLDIRSFTIESADGMFECTVRLYVHTLKELNLLLTRLAQVKGIFSATRMEHHAEAPPA